MHAHWILVANEARARLFEQAADGGDLRELACFTSPEGRAPGRDTTTDRPPTVNESMGFARHAIEPHTTLREKKADRFARELEKALEQGRVDHAFDGLVLIAPPRFLGALHGAFAPTLRRCVVHEVRRNLTGKPAAQIGAYVPKKLELQ